MLRRLVVAVLLSLVAVGAASAIGSTQEGTTSSGITDDESADVPLFLDEGAPMHDVELLEQARQARQLLLDHHARLEQQRRIVEQNSLEHHMRTSQQLGPRAPVETVPPMATIPPPPD